MALREHKFFKPALGAGLAMLCGLALWEMPLGEPWVNASYDYLFRFGCRMPTNQVVLLLMDNESYANLPPGPRRALEARPTRRIVESVGRR